MRRLGVDPGKVRTGLSVCEAGLGVAVPCTTLHHASLAEAVAQVAALARNDGVGEIVVGLPLRLDGTEGEAARRCRRFAGALAEILEIPVVLWDERLSTAAANRALDATRVRGKVRRQVVDQAAATLLLQNYLDAQQQERTCDPDPTRTIPPVLPRSPASPRRSRRRGGHGRGGGST